jgi:uncharacterized membrane protein YdbT with pleckstrin-like domain
MRPLSTLLVLAIMLAGVLLVGAGRYVSPATLAGLAPGWSAEFFQFLGVVIFALASMRLYAWYAPTRFERFTVTDAALVLSRGFMAKQQMEIKLGAVRGLRIDQNWWQRALYIGDLSVYTGGKAPALVVRGLPEPELIRNLVPGQAAAAASA